MSCHVIDPYVTQLSEQYAQLHWAQKLFFPYALGKVIVHRQSSIMITARAFQSVRFYHRLFFPCLNIFLNTPAVAQARWCLDPYHPQVYTEAPLPLEDLNNIKNKLHKQYVDSSFFRWFIPRKLQESMLSEDLNNDRDSCDTLQHFCLDLNPIQRMIFRFFYPALWPIIHPGHRRVKHNQALLNQLNAPMLDIIHHITSSDTRLSAATKGQQLLDTLSACATQWPSPNKPIQSLGEILTQYWYQHPKEAITLEHIERFISTLNNPDFYNIYHHAQETTLRTQSSEKHYQFIMALMDMDDKNTAFILIKQYPQLFDDEHMIAMFKYPSQVQLQKALKLFSSQFPHYPITPQILNICLMPDGDAERIAQDIIRYLNFLYQKQALTPDNTHFLITYLETQQHQGVQNFYNACSKIEHYFHHIFHHPASTPDECDMLHEPIPDTEPPSIFFRILSNLSGFFSKNVDDTLPSYRSLSR